MSARGWVAIAVAMLVGFAIGSLLSPPLGGVRAAIAAAVVVLLWWRLRRVWLRSRRRRAED